jgi:hypothetical protein
MKVKIRKTGEIVNVAEGATLELEMCDSYGDPICMAPEDIELIQEQTEDEHWQDVRERAAIAAMQGMLIGDTAPHDVALSISAVELADALVEELKRSDNVYSECRRMDAINTASVCENMTKIQKELQKKGGQDETDKRTS